MVSKSRPIPVRVMPEEIEKVEADAKAKKLSLAAYVRKKLGLASPPKIGRPPKPKPAR